MINPNVTLVFISNSKLMPLEYHIDYEYAYSGNINLELKIKK